jgi:hypothetical protein
MEAAYDIFYSIYSNGERSSIINDLLQRLAFHALSMMLLATTASHNVSDCDELAEEWETRQAQVLQADYESLAVIIELSLASPTFCKLGPNARELIGVVAFFPQGVDKSNLDQLFHTIPDRKSVLDKLCTLSLTYRNNNFVMTFALIRESPKPQDPRSSSLLYTTKDHHPTRLSIIWTP